MPEHLKPELYDYWLDQVKAVQRIIDLGPAQVVLVNISGVSYVNRDHGHDVGDLLIDGMIDHWLAISPDAEVAYGYQTWMVASPRPLPDGGTLEARLARGHTVDLGGAGLHEASVRTLAFDTEPGDDLDWLMVDHTDGDHPTRAWDW